VTPAGVLREGFGLKKLGIIGGTSWTSTARYYELINRGVAQRLGGLHSASLAIESLDLAPIAAMQQAGDWDGVARMASRAAARLAASGAEALVLASGTLHKVEDAIVAASGLPVLNVADAAAEKIVADRRGHVALLGTRFTMNEEYARDRYRERGIVLHTIAPDWVREVDRIIFDELAAGRVVRDSQRKLKTLITELAKQKVQAIVLGCTELGLAIDARANVLPVYDSCALHARAAVEWMVGEQEAARAAA
jgi:aspartate racemase